MVWFHTGGHVHYTCMHAQDVRAANVKALTDGSLLALHRDDFDALLGSLSHIRHMWRFEALRKACSLAHTCHACIPYVRSKSSPPCLQWPVVRITRFTAQAF